jgi:hypothetical protein
MGYTLHLLALAQPPPNVPQPDNTASLVWAAYLGFPLFAANPLLWVVFAILHLWPTV